MHYKQNNKESRTYVQGLRSFNSTLPRGVKGILKKNGYNYSEIISKWKNLVGKKISDCSYPKSIKMNKGNTKGTLLLSVSRGDEITIEYSKRDIMEKINSFFGYNLINEIRIQTSNSEIKKNKNKNELHKFYDNFKKKIDGISNEDLKNSLSRLLDVVKK